MPLLNPGQIVRDSYEIVKPIGEGAFAEVYAVKHRFIGRQAMKVFKAKRATIEEIERDLTEARLLSTLGHPHIVGVFDAQLLDLEQGTFGYFTMTYMPMTLEQYWRSFGAALMPVAQAVEIIKQTCRGLAVAHSKKPPIIHRDLKPQNILVGYGIDDLHVRVSDFGLAKSVNPLTLLASARGTKGFKPPESLENADSCAGDVWALGTTLYLLLTDKMPYPILDDAEYSSPSWFARPLRPPSVYNITVDSGLESILYRCLQIAPEDRYANVLELLQDLDRWKPGNRLDSMSVSSLGKTSKTALAPKSRHDFKAEAKSALDAALEVAQDPAQLMNAASLLEEAICKDPSLRERYELYLQLWRKGVMHCPTTTGKLQSRSSPH